MSYIAIVANRDDRFNKNSLFDIYPIVFTSVATQVTLRTYGTLVDNENVSLLSL